MLLSLEKLWSISVNVAEDNSGVVTLTVPEIVVDEDVNAGNEIITEYSLYNGEQVITTSSTTDLTYTIEDSRLHFSVEDAEKAIPNIIQKLSKINIPIYSITTETSSLEDVFLDLTGKSINEWNSSRILWLTGLDFGH